VKGGWNGEIKKKARVGGGDGGRGRGSEGVNGKTRKEVEEK